MGCVNSFLRFNVYIYFECNIYYIFKNLQSAKSAPKYINQSFLMCSMFKLYAFFKHICIFAYMYPYVNAIHVFKGSNLKIKNHSSTFNLN